MFELLGKKLSSNKSYGRHNPKGKFTYLVLVDTSLSCIPYFLSRLSYCCLANATLSVNLVIGDSFISTVKIGYYNNCFVFTTQ